MSVSDVLGPALQTLAYIKASVEKIQLNRRSLRRLANECATLLASIQETTNDDPNGSLANDAVLEFELLLGSIREMTDKLSEDSKAASWRGWMKKGDVEEKIRVFEQRINAIYREFHLKVMANMHRNVLSIHQQLQQTTESLRQMELNTSASTPVDSRPKVSTSRNNVYSQPGRDAISKKETTRFAQKELPLPPLPPPAQNAWKGRRPPIIGIDLGSTRICSSVFDASIRRVRVIPNEYLHRTTPSVVSFRVNGQVLVGETALINAAHYPLSTFFGTKRLIGKPSSSDQVQSYMKSWLFPNADEGGASSFSREVRKYAKLHDPEDIAHHILKKVHQEAESFLQTSVTQCIITIPVSFTFSQRQATYRAAKAAGLIPVRLISEPVAAAFAYDFMRILSGTDLALCEAAVLVFDLGGGSLDVSFLVIQEGIVDVRAVSGNHSLGGEDFDRRIVEHIADVVRQETGRDPRQYPTVMRRLAIASEGAKRELSTAARTLIHLPDLFDGYELYTHLTRATFEQICEDLFESCLESIRTTMKSSSQLYTHKDPDEVLLIGGSTRMPRIREIVSDYFGGKEIGTAIDPHEAVSIGAAVLGAQLSGEEGVGDVLMLNVTPIRLGVEIFQDGYRVFLPVIEENTCYPALRLIKIRPLRDRQTMVRIKVLEKPRFSPNKTFLGHVDLSFPPGRAVENTITLGMHIDANYVIRVDIKHVSSGRESRIFIKENERLPEAPPGDQDDCDVTLVEEENAYPHSPNPPQ